MIVIVKGVNIMYIEDKWYSESEAVAHVYQLYAALHLAAEIITIMIDDSGIPDSELYYKIKDFEAYEKTLP